MFESSSRRQFQKGLDADKQRALRRDSELSLRRKQREEHLQKRRKKIINRGNNNNTSNNNRNIGEQQEAVPLISDIPKYVQMVFNTSSLELNLKGTTGIRQLLSIERDPPTAQICGTGVIPKIISFMYDNTNNNTNNNNDEIKLKLQFESAWVLTNIAASSTQLVSYIVKNGAIEAFVDLFRNTTSPEIADQAVWGLGNIAGDGRLFRNRIIQTGFLNDIVRNIHDLSEEMQQNTVWTISNLFRYKDPMKVADIMEISQLLCRLLRESKDDAVIADCMWALHYISTNPSEGIINHLVLETGVINDCMRLLEKEKCKYEIALHQFEKGQRKQNSYFINNNKEGVDTQNKNNNDQQLLNINKQALLKMNDKVYRPCLRLIGNVLSEPDDLTQAVLDAGYLDVIQPWANHFCSSIRREVMWSFSNILAGSHQQIESLISRDTLLNAIMNAGMYGAIGVKKEAAWCICNAMADAITQQKKSLVEHGAIEVLAGMLKPQHNIKESALVLVIEGLEGILGIYGKAGSMNPYADMFEELEGLDHLERIQADENLSEDAYNAIIMLMRKYYDTDDIIYNNGEEGGELLTAKIDTNTNQFAFGVGGINNTKNNNTSNNNFGNRNNPFGCSNNMNNNRQIYQF
mmetsp:Transcript_46770/g.41841  ORF Transcript_46770/g.41841 Transcript_46770/m.41841 type:complete len:633 (+) Transcript_46770:210-2108(+)